MDLVLAGYLAFWLT